MKKMLPLLFAALAGLASCSKSSDPAAKAADAPSLLNTWTFQSETVVTTLKAGGASTTSTQSIKAGSYTVSYGANGVLTTKTATGTNTGSYTYSGSTITIPYSSANGPKAQVLTVTELTASKLTTLENTEDTANRYAVTDVFTR